MADGRVILPFSTFVSAGYDPFYGPTWCHGSSELLIVSENGSRSRKILGDTRDLPEDGWQYSCPQADFKVIPTESGYIAWGPDQIFSMDENFAFVQGGYVHTIGNPGPGLEEVIELDDHTLLARFGASQFSSYGTYRLSETANPLAFSFEPHTFETRVTSMFAVAGGFATTQADGTVSGPDPSFSQMHLTSMAPPESDRRYTGAHENAIVSMAGPAVSSAESTWAPTSAGDSSQANSSKIPVLEHFVPSPLGKPEDPYPAEKYGAYLTARAFHGYLRGLVLLNVGPKATVARFLRALKDPRNDVVAFIGHANQQPAVGSVGLTFFDKGIVKENHGYEDLRGPTYTYPVDVLKTTVKVVFIASCETADMFKSLWDITTSTRNRALIVPLSTEVTSVNLFWGSMAWVVIAEALTNGGTAEAPRPGKSVYDAVQAGNKYLRENSRSLQFQVIGFNEGRNVRIP
jgi:hypothetical protein